MDERDEQLRRIHDEIIKRFTDNGKLIEAGWAAMRIMTLPANISRTQETEMRRAFFSGAQHLYTSIMTVLEEGQEPTEKDIKRMELIETELEAFRMDMIATHSSGRA